MSSASATEPAETTSYNILQKILDTARECVLVVDTDLRVRHGNAAATAAFGRGLGIENKRLSEIFRDLDLNEAFRQAVTKRISSDVRLELARAGERKFDVHIAPVELNREHMAIGFFYETTQIDRLESVRQEFLSNISHELRTPLTSILAFVETLENGGIDDEENKLHFLGVIRRNAERMNSLIADILELSLIESGRVSMDIRQIDLASAVEDVLTALWAKAQNRRVELLNCVPAGTTVAADTVRMEQMLTNLIDNAIKFNREGGLVTVEYKRSGRRHLISVTDTGEGILPEHTGRIFERFYRTDKARSRDLGGTGLGLSIVKHLARLHGGEVSVRSVLTEGTTFTMELPS